jgi:cation:H+ antiporter
MLAYGLLLLMVSSRILVWGAVEVARAFEVSELLIGLTVVALGTSLPELASAASASRKGEDDLALGNVLGSNLFNTLAVVGLAGVIRPADVDPAVVGRDIPVMLLLTLALFVFGYGFGGDGRVNRYEAALLLSAYLAYTGYLISTTFA